MREAAQCHYGAEDILVYFDAQRLRAHRLGCTSLIADPNAGIFHADMDDDNKAAYHMQAMELIPRLHERGLPVFLHCARKECRSYATLMLGLGVGYIRIHAPHIAVRLMK